MTPEILLSLKIYALAIAISMVVALIIRGVVVMVSLRQRKPQVEREPTRVAAPTDAAGHIAAISAAIYVMTGAHRIVHIRALGRSGAWTVEGRFAPHSSHAVPHQPRKHKE